ncbi:MAG: hypothetical protein K6E78_09575 [Treponema sp.]|nr:hypothetical protein [Treponema sp.]
MKKTVIKKAVMAFAGLLFSSFLAFSQEMKGSIDVDFFSGEENASYTEWTGGYSPSEINTRSQIKDIGRRLANGIQYQETEENDPFPYNKGNPAYKYSAARVYGTSKRGADVILIGETATVDTIKCLKMILQGYVENAYGISPSESEGLAQALCNWNTALYNNSYLLNQFEDGVKDAFSGYATKTGLSNSFREWKKSVLVIPHVFTEAAENENQYESDFDYSDNSLVQESVPEQVEENVEEKNEADYSSANTYSNQNSKNIKKQNKKGGNNKMIILAAACGGAIALAAIIIILLTRKKA